MHAPWAPFTWDPKTGRNSPRHGSQRRSPGAWRLGLGGVLGASGLGSLRVLIWVVATPRHAGVKLH